MCFHFEVLCGTRVFCLFIERMQLTEGACGLICELSSPPEVPPPPPCPTPTSICYTPALVSCRLRWNVIKNALGIAFVLY